MDIYNRFIEIIKESRDDLDSLRSVLKEFCRYSGAGALLRDNSNELEMTVGGDFIKYDGLARFNQPVFNAETDGFKTLVFPVIAALNHLGTLVFFRRDTFSPEEIDVAEVCAIIASLKLAKILDEKESEQALNLSSVRGAIGSLTYSELLAVTLIFEKIEREGIIIARNLAERHSITRSVIVTALKKLESAGIVEVRSLGMKGTHIKVLNALFIGEIRKLNV